PAVAAPAAHRVLAPQQSATDGLTGVVAIWRGNDDAGGEHAGADERCRGSIAEPGRQLSRDRSRWGAERADSQARRRRRAGGVAPDRLDPALRRGTPRPGAVRPGGRLVRRT